MDTEYTKGFKAGMAWREAEIIKLLEENLESWEEGIVFRKGYNIANVPSLIALIKGEK